MDDVAQRMQVENRKRAGSVFVRLGAGRTALAAIAFVGMTFTVTAWPQSVVLSADSASQPAASHASGAPLPSSIPVRRDAPSSEGDGAGDRWWVAILFVGGLLACGVIAARRKQAKADLGARSVMSWFRLGGLIDTVSSREIERVSSTRLSPRHSLHVVVWNGKRLLLGCTDQSIQVLSEALSPEPALPKSEQGQE